jgi:hypothetical protein
MSVRSKVMTTTAALAAAVLSTGPLAVTGATTAPSPAAALARSSSHVPVVMVHVSKRSIQLSVGHRLHAGRVIFKVMARRGAHDLQLARLHKGYTMQDAAKDFRKVSKGDIKAIRRIDTKISWLGGASARPGRPGKFAVNLHASRVFVTDQESNAVTRLRIFGSAPSRPSIPASSAVTAFSYGFGTSGPTLPRSGWTRIRNQSDQPHFVYFNRVKDTTTNHMVRRLIKHPNGNPSWILKVNTTAEVISPKRLEVFHYDLPAGKYLIACFWPDDDTGMPHFFMGMFKLIRLQ